MQHVQGWLHTLAKRAPPRRERDKAQKQRGAWHRDSHLAQSFALPNIAPSDNIRYNQDDHCLH